MAFNYATAKTKLNLFLTARALVATDLAAITALGARPAMPDIILDQTAYDDATTAIATWDADYATAKAAYDTDYAAMRSIEFEIIFYLQPNQWEKFTNAGGGVLTYTWYIGYCPTDPIDPQNGPMSGDNTQDIARQFVVFSATEPATSFVKTTSI